MLFIEWAEGMPIKYQTQILVRETYNILPLWDTVIAKNTFLADFETKSWQETYVTVVLLFLRALHMW